MSAVRRAVLASGAVILAGGLTTASATAGRSPRSDFQAAAVAIPSEAARQDGAQKLYVGVTGATSVQVSGSATTSVTCDACRGESLSLQVLHATEASSLVVRNVAAAWVADCSGCSGWAVSVQVIVAASPAALRAGNRALALNAGCSSCQVSAAAVQYVVLGSDGRELSTAALERIVSLRAELLTALRSAGSKTLPIQRPTGTRTVRPAGPRGAIKSTVARMQAVLAVDLEATSVRHDVKISQR